LFIGYILPTNARRFTMLIYNKNLAIANRSRVSCAHNTLHWGHL